MGWTAWPTAVVLISCYSSTGVTRHCFLAPHVMFLVRLITDLRRTTCLIEGGHSQYRSGVSLLVGHQLLSSTSWC